MTPWVIRDYNDWMRIGQQLTPILDGSPFQVTVKRFKRSRTNDQNKKLHAMLRDLALFTGYTESQMKDIAKAQYAPMITRRVGDKSVSVPMGTSDMNVEQSSEFIERLYQLGAEIGCVFTGE